jgi:hypothetical protein
MKRFFWITAFGALFGAILFAWISPYIIVWYFSPPAELSISCSPAVQWAINTYRKVIFTGVFLGALIAAILSLSFFRAKPAPDGAQDVLPKA